MLVIEIINDQSGTEETGHYEYYVHVNGKKIDSGKVTNHKRTNPWYKLLALILEQYIPAENND